MRGEAVTVLDCSFKLMQIVVSSKGFQNFKRGTFDTDVVQNEKNISAQRKAGNFSSV